VSTDRFRLFSLRPGDPNFGEKIAQGRQGACPKQSVTIRLKVRNIFTSVTKIKGFKAFVLASKARPDRGAAYLVGGPVGVNGPAQTLCDV
jgi:hypothetical protein